MSSFTINIESRQLILSEENRLSDRIDFTITGIETSSLINLKFELLNATGLNADPAGASGSNYITILNISGPEQFPAKYGLDTLGEQRSYIFNESDNPAPYEISFEPNVVVGSLAIIRCTLVSSSNESIPSPNFIDITLQKQ